LTIDLLGGTPTVCPQGIIALATFIENRTAVPVAIIHKERAACARCPLAPHCVRVAGKQGTEVIIIDLYAYSLLERRTDEQTDAFQDRYRPRGGIEGTNSEVKRGQGLGDLRGKRGLSCAKPHGKRPLPPTTRLRYKVR